MSPACHAIRHTGRGCVCTSALARFRLLVSLAQQQINAQPDPNRRPWWRAPTQEV